MKKNIDQILAEAEKQANELIAEKAAIREAFAPVCNNSAKKSTVAGSLRAFRVIVENHIPTAYEQKQ